MSNLGALKPFTIEKPEPIIGAKTIQLILMREVLDYTVLRTEETRELNTAATPLSINGDGDALRVAFFGSKQKAAESRQLEQMLRTATKEEKVDVPSGAKHEGCYLKDNLCLRCPRCALFGGTNVEAAKEEKFAQIKHRLEYGTAYSLLPFEDVESATTFNAITDLNQVVGQALGTRYAVAPATVFPSIVTLRSVTLTEVILVIKMLRACRSYGAESRIGGDMRNSIFGIAGGWEEVITPLELTLELYDKRPKTNDNAEGAENGSDAEKERAEINGDTVKKIVKKYETFAGNPDKVTIFEPAQVDKIVEEAAKTPLTKDFLSKAYEDAHQYREEQKGK